MFDLVEKNKTAVQVVLGMVSLGLIATAGFTYDALQREDPYLAKVGKTLITERELAEAAGGQNISEEMKPALVEQLVEQQLLVEEAKEQRVTITKDALQKLIAAEVAFQVDGKFDPARYKEVLTQQNMTPEIFEERATRNLSLRMLTDSVFQSGISSNAMRDRIERLLGEKREVQVAHIYAKDLLKLETVSPAEVKQYYDSHAAEFKKPEQVKLEYVVLAQSEISGSIKITDDEVQKYFDQHKQEITKEERKARHILLTLPAEATAAQKAELKKQAEALLADVRKDPSRFAEIAKAKSQDPGSAEQGGDLGWFGRGAMVKSFEDATFALNKAEISGVVESKYGFHIIKLDDLRARTLADARPEIEARLKAQKAQTAYQTQKEKLNELVYNHSDSLKSAMDEFKLVLNKSDWLSRQGSQDILLSNPKVIESAFSDDVLKKKHNSEAIEVMPGTTVVVRVAEHKPEQMQAMTEVSAQISDKLRMEKALKRAKENGLAQLQALQAGKKVDLKWEKPQEAMRIGGAINDDAQLKSIFRAPADKLPAYVGGESKNIGFDVYRVNKVTQGSALAPEARQRMADALSQMYGQVAMTSYIEALRNKNKVVYRNEKPKTE